MWYGHPFATQCVSYPSPSPALPRLGLPENAFFLNRSFPAPCLSRTSPTRISHVLPPPLSVLTCIVLPPPELVSPPPKVFSPSSPVLFRVQLTNSHFFHRLTVFPPPVLGLSPPIPFCSPQPPPLLIPPQHDVLTSHPEKSNPYLLFPPALCLSRLFFPKSSLL